MSANPTRKLFNVHEYHQMGEAGILSARDRVELIHGEILIKPMMGPPHCASVDRVSLAMHRASDNHYIVRTQGAVRLYAETGIPEYWIVDIPNDYLHVYSDVLQGSYRTIRQLRRGDMISPTLLPNCSLVIDTLLP